MWLGNTLMNNVTIAGPLLLRPGTGTLELSPSTKPGIWLKWLKTTVPPLRLGHTCVRTAMRRTRVVHPQHEDLQLDTVEHLMAALAIAGISACTLHVPTNRAEVPLLDGTVEAYLKLIEAAGGTRELPTPQAPLVLHQPVEYKHGWQRISLTPLKADQTAPRLTCAINFTNNLWGWRQIGQQEAVVEWHDLRAEA